MFSFQNIASTHMTVPPRQHRQVKENTELLSSIARAKLELEIANQNFSYVTDPLLVDVYTYQIKAAQAKYRYLLQKARSLDSEQTDCLKQRAAHL